MSDPSAKELLFDGYEKAYHQIDHIRLRIFKALLGAEQQMITDSEVQQAINALPLMERCRALAVKSCVWGKYPALPEIPPGADGTGGRPAQPEREFSLDAKTTAVMMAATNSRSFGDEEARLAYATMQLDPNAEDVFDGMVQLVAMSRATNDQVPLVTLALRERGQVKRPDGEWIPLKDTITESDVRVLPQPLIDKVREFLTWEQVGWPATGKERGKPQAQRGRASTPR